MRDLRRIVVCEEPQRNKDCTAGVPTAPTAYMEALAARFGAAFGVPYVALGVSLEECELTDFVFYQGYWDSFVEATPQWTEEQRRLRAHRTVHLNGSRVREYQDLLERAGFAFSIPGTEMGGKRPGVNYTFIYGRRDIAAALDFKTTGTFGTKTYAEVRGSFGMSQEEMVVRYLGAYWDRLGY